MNPGLDERIAEARLDQDNHLAGAEKYPDFFCSDAVTDTVRDKISFIRKHAWTLNLFAWSVTVVLLVAAGLRVFAHDATYTLNWLNAFTRYVYLPAYGCLVWAIWRRRWGLLVANFVIVVCHVTWVAPDFERDRRFDIYTTYAAAQTDQRPTLRIFFANVRADNPNKAAILEEIEAVNPDVAVLVEFTRDWYAAFRAAPEMQPFAYHTDISHARVGLVNVFSKLPLETESQVFGYGRTLQTVDVRVGSERLRIMGLHGPRPTSRFGNYQQFWQEAISRLSTEQGPVVVVGDFNATQYSRVYRDLIAGRLRSAHEDRGRGYATTWPNGRYWLPPIRIDQAFVSLDVECLNIAEGIGRGSDHKPLILDVALRTTKK
jgi:endonuclease/exonuclease/phosphatase (EEP) superfamily protein YafD